MGNAIKQRVKDKTTVKEELEYWNVLYLFRRLNVYYRNKLRGKAPKSLQGLESADFAMKVLEKIISEDVSWTNSTRVSFIDFVYDIASGELSHFIRDNKERKFVSYEAYLDLRIPIDRNLGDHFNGF
jgi:hypothetical protein